MKSYSYLFLVFQTVIWLGKSISLELYPQTVFSIVLLMACITDFLLIPYYNEQALKLIINCFFFLVVLTFFSILATDQYLMTQQLPQLLLGAGLTISQWGRLEIISKNAFIGITIYVTGLITVIAILRNQFVSQIDHVQLVFMIFVPQYLMLCHLREKCKRTGSIDYSNAKSIEHDRDKYYSNLSPKAAAENYPMNSSSPLHLNSIKKSGLFDMDQIGDHSRKEFNPLARQMQNVSQNDDHSAHSQHIDFPLHQREARLAMQSPVDLGRQYLNNVSQVFPQLKRASRPEQSSYPKNHSILVSNINFDTKVSQPEISLPLDDVKLISQSLFRDNIKEFTLEHHFNRQLQNKQEIFDFFSKKILTLINCSIQQLYLWDQKSDGNLQQMTTGCSISLMWRSHYLIYSMIDTFIVDENYCVAILKLEQIVQQLEILYSLEKNLRKIDFRVELEPASLSELVINIDQQRLLQVMILLLECYLSRIQPGGRLIVCFKRKNDDRLVLVEIHQSQENIFPQQKQIQLVAPQQQSVIGESIKSIKESIDLRTLSICNRILQIINNNNTNNLKIDYRRDQSSVSFYFHEGDTQMRDEEVTSQKTLFEDPKPQSIKTSKKTQNLIPKSLACDCTHVMVIDNDHQNQFVLEQILQSHRLKLKFYYDEQTALDRLQTCSNIHCQLKAIFIHIRPRVSQEISLCVKVH